MCVVAVRFVVVLVVVGYKQTDAAPAPILRLLFL